MGYRRHHAIIVTSSSAELLAAAHAAAVRIFPHVSEILPSVVNSCGSFFVPPDGSKEGWMHSDEGDTRRDTFIAWLNAQRYDDGSTSFKWAEVMYGDDSGMAAVVRHDSAPEATPPTPERP